MKLHDSIRYIDIHTHKGRGSTDTITVRNLIAGKEIPAESPDNTYFSCGIHPWYLNEKNIDEQKTAVEGEASEPDVIMIGEAGFDKLRGPAVDIQKKAFMFQAELAERLCKPLIIHCVKYWDLLLELHQGLMPSVNWVVHGFRGGPGLASSLLREGIWLSFGRSGLKSEVLNKDFIQVHNQVLINRLLLETDDDEISISEVYKDFSEVTGIPGEDVAYTIKTNFRNLFSTNS